MTGSVKPNPPQAPNSGAINAAQSFGDVNTAVSNSWLQNANVNTPTGSVNYSTGPARTMQIPILGPNGEFGGFQNIDVPSFNRSETLAPAQQFMLDQQNQLGENLNNIALNQSRNIGGQLDAPINASGLPARTNSYGAAPTFQQVGNGPNLAQSGTTFGDTGSAQRSFADTGSAQRSFADTGSQQGTIGDYGAAKRDFGDTGFATNDVGDTGWAITGFGDAGGLQRSLGPNDYAAQRSNVENAIYSRLNPQLDRDRNALETKLVNQGLVRGTDAFNTAMDESNRQANDARMQAVLAGGQEQSRLAGLDLQSGQFANSAEQQAYNQNLGRGQFANQAVGQNFNQALQRGQFANAAAEQNLNQGLQRTNLYNSGQAQDVNQALQRAGLFNTAQAENTAQGAQRANLYNAGQAQDFGQAAQRGAFFNAGQDQDFSQANQRGLFGLQATNQNNQALQQQYQDQANATQTNNQTAQQQFGNTQAAAQFGNENRQQALQETLALRNQPMNEISALLSGGQISMPQFQAYNPGTIANNSLGQNIYNSAALNQQAYQTQQSGTNAFLGALGGLGGAGLYGLAKKYG